MSNHDIRRGQSVSPDASLAVREFYEAVSATDVELVIFFCSSNYDLTTLAAEMRRLFAGVQVVGCTTAGEIGPQGYRQHSLTGASFSRQNFSASSGSLEQLSQFDIPKGHDFVQDLLQRLEAKSAAYAPQNTFALLLIDGMSRREEFVAHTIQYALGKIQLFGGSAGDDLKLEQTHVFFNGDFHTDSAVLCLVNTPLLFDVFLSQHLLATDERLVVTAADSALRVVKEINGLPAAEEYARIAGLDLSELTPEHFAFVPVLVKIGGKDYVRSIQKVNQDGSLSFYCAIEEGVVLRVAHGGDLLGSLRNTFDVIHEKVGIPQLVLSCDCILRNLEMNQLGIKEQAGELLRNNNTIGFSSYGEQFHGVHVNQTFTGIAIGSHAGS